jgi:hypothetical protein
VYSSTSSASPGWKYSLYEKRNYDLQNKDGTILSIYGVLYRNPSRIHRRSPFLTTAKKSNEKRAPYSIRQQNRGEKDWDKIDAEVEKERTVNDNKVVNNNKKPSKYSPL